MKHIHRIFYFLIVVLLGKAQLAVSLCDSSKSADLREGNIGDSGHFPWLGVLRVHLHHGESMKIAVTGLVLVKQRYAIANSDDVSKIPKNIFRQDSKAMFIPKGAEPWYCKLSDYMMHPEYEFSTFNTIALVELALDDYERVPLEPICWPGYFFNTSNELYALGFTDENQLLEKIIYKLQYVKQSLCNEFYSRAGLSNDRMIPTHMQCGFATTNKKHCQFENGMVLASNSSGKWHLIGISLRGPGCSAPARFINLFPYLPWIDSATDLEEINDYNADFRRSNGDKVVDEAVDSRWAYKYKGDSSSLHPFTIHRVDQDAIMITKFDDMYEAERGNCSHYKNLVYRDKMRIVDTGGLAASASYRLSVYDMWMAGYTCVKLKVNAKRRSPAKLWYRYAMEPELQQTPDELLKYYPVYKAEASPTTPSPDDEATTRYKWIPGKHLKPQFVEDTANYTGIKNLNILIWFSFIGEAKLEVQVFGIALPIWTHREPYPTRPPDKEKISQRRNNKLKKSKKNRLPTLFA